MSEKGKIVVVVVVISSCLILLVAMSIGIYFYMNTGTPKTSVVPAATATTPAGTAVAEVTCTSDASWDNKSAKVGETITKACPGGGNESAVCRKNGDNWAWEFTGCPK